MGQAVGQALGQRGGSQRGDLRRSEMWYFICLLVGAVLGGLATSLRYETRCRDCGVRENCEEFP